MYQIYFILEWHSTCFGRSFRPSPAVQDCTYSNMHMWSRYCCLPRPVVPKFSWDCTTSHYDPPKTSAATLLYSPRRSKREWRYGSSNSQTDQSYAPTALRQRKWRRYHLNGRRGVLQNCSHVSKNLWLLPGIEPRFLNCSGRSLVTTPTALSTFSYNIYFYWYYDYIASGTILHKSYLTYSEEHLCEVGQGPISKSFVLARC